MDINTYKHMLISIQSFVISNIYIHKFNSTDSLLLFRFYRIADEQAYFRIDIHSFCISTQRKKLSTQRPTVESTIVWFSLDGRNRFLLNHLKMAPSQILRTPRTLNHINVFVKTVQCLMTNTFAELYFKFRFVSI